MYKSAILSDDGVYRYRLTRVWDPAIWHLSFIMLNPSTADAEIDDPTIIRCKGFAEALGYGGIVVYNLFAFRATKPPVMWEAARSGVDIVGPENDDLLRSVLRVRAEAGVPTVAAWGANARPYRVNEVLAMDGADNLFHLGLTQQGIPRHPLMLPKTARLEPLI